jgi:hypothetical protein
MKRFAVLLLIAAAASAAPVKSHDIYVNGKFLISSYNVDGKQVVALDDVRKAVGGRIAVNNGKVFGEPTSDLRGAHLRKNVVLGNVLTLQGRQWISTADFVQQIAGANAVNALSRLGAGAALQLALFDCPDVRCCPDCGIAMH